MKCLYCQNSHDGNYGSGKFCSKKCACGFSTKNKRAEINEKVRLKSLEKGESQTKWLNTPEAREKRKKTMLERYGSTFHLSKKNREKNINVIREKRLLEYQNKPFNDLSLAQKKRRLIEHRGYNCEWCGISSWREQKIQLELDHINGCKMENTENNLRLLCPNCHSQTPTWRKKKQKD